MSQRIGRPMAIYLTCGLLLSLGLQTAQAEVRRYKRTVSASTDTVIGIGTRWNGACKHVGVPQVSLDNAPEHGTVCIRTGPVKPRNLLFGKADQCLGMTMDGVQIVYQAHPGFTGPDTVGYTMTFPRGARSYSVRLTITSDAQHSRPRGGPRLYERQSPGRIPECSALTSWSRPFKMVVRERII